MTTTSLLPYPGGSAGIAVLLLRASLATCLAANSIRCNPAAGYAVPMAILALLLAVGMFARAAATLSSIGLLVSGYSLSSSQLPVFAIAAAIILLGAGAYSIDAQVFGRRPFQWNGRT